MNFLDRIKEYLSPSITSDSAGGTGEGIFRSYGGHIGNVSTQPNMKVKQIIYTIVSANVEYPLEGLSGYAAFLLKAQNGDVYISLYENQSLTRYTLLSPGQSLEFSLDTINIFGNIPTIYVSAPVAGTILEIIGLRT